MESKHKMFKEDNKKPKIIRKTARLVVRNLPFSCSEQEVEKHFSQFGNIQEVKLLRKNDDRLVGCGFVQFENKLAASNALSHTSGEPFKGRPIIVDWAVPKRKYHSIKCEESTNVDSNESELSNKSVASKITEDSSDETILSDNSKRKTKTNNSRMKKFCPDVDNGRTVFFKNVPFSVDNEQLRECAEELAGPVEYAVICLDPLTEHSKGTAFIRFKKKHVAEKVLNNECKLVLLGKELQPHQLLKKEDLLGKHLQNKTLKDKRNLYLFKEGLIVAGTAAARGVSQADMNKRLLLEQQRTRLLKNLHKFLSTNRLVVYNLPFYNFDNKKLLLLFKKYSPKDAVISEARVMRNLKDLDESGMPKSKGYGFVSYEKHEDALSALRAINNNPEIFRVNKRPIVLFSIEDKGVLLIKQKRQEKAKKQKSGDTSPDSKMNSEQSQSEPRKEVYSSNKFNKKQNKNSKTQDNGNSKKSIPKFVGVTGKPGVIKFPKKHKLQAQAITHKNHVKKELIRKKLANKKQSRKQIRLKKNLNK